MLSLSPCHKCAVLNIRPDQVNKMNPSLWESILNGWFYCIIAPKMYLDLEEGGFCILPTLIVTLSVQVPSTHSATSFIAMLCIHWSQHSSLWPVILSTPHLHPPKALSVWPQEFPVPVLWTLSALREQEESTSLSTFLARRQVNILFSSCELSASLNTSIWKTIWFFLSQRGLITTDQRSHVSLQANTRVKLYHYYV